MRQVIEHGRLQFVFIHGIFLRRGDPWYQDVRQKENEGEDRQPMDHVGKKPAPCRRARLLSRWALKIHS
jgi:hypothetical protein